MPFFISGITKYNLNHLTIFKALCYTSIRNTDFCFHIHTSKGTITMNKEKFNYNIAILLGFLFLSSIMPLLYLSRYNQSWADDYSYGFLAYTAWNQTHSLWQVIVAAFEQVKSSYLLWQGTYSGIFLMAIQPGIFGDEYYIITTFLMLFLLSTSVLYFFKKILIDCLKGDKPIWLITSLTTLLLVIQLMPDPVQAFYWYNGSLYYLGFFSFLLFMLGDYIKLLQDTQLNHISKLRFILSTSILGAIIGGGNYVGSLIAVEICVLTVLAAICCGLKTAKRLFPSITLLIIGFCFSMAAPGNAVRSATFPEKKDVFESIHYSFRLGIEYINEWINLYLILALLFLIPFLWEVVHRKDKMQKFYRFPWLIAILSFCLFASSFTPTLYSTGGLGQNPESAGRVQNIRYLLFVLLIIINLIYTLGWLKGRVRESEKSLDFSAKDRLFYNGFIIAGIGVLLLCPKTFNDLTSVSAVYSYYTGELQDYAQEAAARKKLLESNENIVTLNPYQARPRLLYYYNDIQTNEYDWKNEIIAAWYGKEKVYLSQEQAIDDKEQD